MPYVLSGIIRSELEGMWREGAPYSKQNIYDICRSDPKLPPVQYDAHILKPHSLCHVDAPAHIIREGKTIDQFFAPGTTEPFFGKTVVVKIAIPSWTAVEGMPSHFVHRVSERELREAVFRVTGHESPPEKLFVSAESVPLDRNGAHDPRYALVLEESAASWLISSPKFNAYGTSWKSTDFMLGSRERPIHKLIFSQALIFECLKMDHVPEGIYLLSGFPLPLEGASESPVCPVLFCEAEMKAILGWG